MLSSTQLGSTQTITDPAYKAAHTEFGDSVACISWLQSENANPSDDFGLVCSSWDSKVYFYGVAPPTSAYQPVRDVEGLIIKPIDYPAISLAVDFSTKKVIGGAIDGSIYLLDPNRSVVQTIGKHEDAVKGIYYAGNENTVCSVSYDKTLKFWDTRMQGPRFSLNVGSKVLCSDMLSHTIALGLDSDKLLILDLNDSQFLLSSNMDISKHYLESPLGNNSPLSAVSISKENVIGVGSCDGRSNLSSFSKRSDGVNRISNIVTFKAHKIDPGQGGNTSDLKILYPISSVGLHPRNKDTYFTAGGDGSVVFWDIPARNKLTSLSCHPAPITAAKYSPDGKYLAYAFGYDWAKGVEGAQSIKTKLHVHTIQSSEFANV